MYFRAITAPNIEFHRLDKNTPEDNTPVTYPTDYFINNECAKPFIYYRAGSIKSLYQEAWTSIHNGIWPDQTMAGFMLAYIKEYQLDEFTGKLAMDWVSYIITIGKKDHFVTPLDLVTLISRYMGCACLMSLTQVGKTLNVEVTDMFVLATTPHVRMEMGQVLVANQEMGFDYGYFPYQADLGIVSKSPYSITANPSLYLWLHVLGTLSIFRTRCV